VSKHYVTKQSYTRKFSGLKRMGVISRTKGIFYTAGRGATENSRRWDLVARQRDCQQQALWSCKRGDFIHRKD